VQALLKFQQLVRVGAVEAWVLGNLSLLRRLTAILLDNAVKYTPEYGMITVSIEVRDEMVHLDVIDTGIGITTEDTGQIFDRFFRGDRSRGRENGGKGLGLAIARWIADTHGAEIRVSSAPGQGSVFTVSLQCMRSVPESTPLSLSA